MPDIRVLLLALITGLAALFLWRWWAAVDRHDGARLRPAPLHVAIGFVVAFLDTLGIGSLATTTAVFRALRVVPDERLPATIIVGLTLTVVAQALIFIARIAIDPVLLALMIAMALAGGWVGAGIVSRLPRRPIQAGMGVGLLLAALFMAAAQLQRMPVGGTALSLAGAPLWIALGANFAFGALIMIGIGNYGPTFVLLSALGMDPRAAFPIMMGSGAIAALLGCLAFVRRRAQVDQPALGLALGGVPGVLVAALLVTGLPIGLLRWLVIGVVTYSALTMLRAATQGAGTADKPVSAAPPRS
ncbi:MAG: sulfite exporter TauE/SafE family protein [Gemmatimonadales bacterium]|nr:sulfite exporter TauE/SafE family protein [Gemmatimonadales bacterium]